jgi:hypothetical protein
MKNFYEMMMLIEDDNSEGLGDQTQASSQNTTTPKEPDQNAKDGMEYEHYMFFSNLKSIKEKAEAMLSMDPTKVDEMLKDGHDWASDHISTSRDDVEEVYNWLSGRLA